MRCWKAMPPDEHYYGLGEQAGPLDRRGRSFVMGDTDAYGWGVTTTPLYVTIPFFLGLREGRAAVVDAALRLALNARPSGSQGCAPGSANDHDKNQNKSKTKNKNPNKKGDTSNEVRKGTFLKSFDTKSDCRLPRPASLKYDGRGDPLGS